MEWGKGEAISCFQGGRFGGCKFCFDDTVTITQIQLLNFVLLDAMVEMSAKNDPQPNHGNLVLEKTDLEDEIKHRKETEPEFDEENYRSLLGQGRGAYNNPLDYTKRKSTYLRRDDMLCRRCILVTGVVLLSFHIAVGEDNSAIG